MDVSIETITIFFNDMFQKIAFGDTRADYYFHTNLNKGNNNSNNNIEIETHISRMFKMG